MLSKIRSIFRRPSTGSVTTQAEHSSFCVGVIVDGCVILEMGEKIMVGPHLSFYPETNPRTREDNFLVPVRFGAGFGIYDGRCHSLLKEGRPEIDALILNSELMPAIQRGVGTDVYHVHVIQEGKPVRIKLRIHSNAWRGCEIYR